MIPLHWHLLYSIMEFTQNNLHSKAIYPFYPIRHEPIIRITTCNTVVVNYNKNNLILLKIFCQWKENPYIKTAVFWQEWSAVSQKGLLCIRVLYCHPIGSSDEVRWTGMGKNVLWAEHKSTNGGVLMYIYYTGTLA